MATALFSAVGIVGKAIPLDAPTLSFWRGLPALATSLVAFEVTRRWGSAKGERFVWPRARESWALIAAGLLNAANWAAFFQSIRVSSVSVAVISLFTFPFFTALLEPVVFREKLRRQDLVGGLLVLIGVGLLQPRLAWGDSVTQGVFWGVVSAVTLTIRNMLGRRLVSQRPANQTMIPQYAIAVIVFLPWGLRLPSELQPVDWLNVLLLGAVLTTVSQGLFLASLKWVSAAWASLVTSLQPVVTVAFAMAFLGERPGIGALLGSVVIMLGVAWPALTKAKPRPGEALEKSPA